MLYTHQARLPYSSQGLAALQKTLELHAGVSSPVLFMEPDTGSIRVKSAGLGEPEMEEEEE